MTQPHSTRRGHQAGVNVHSCGAPTLGAAGARHGRLSIPRPDLDLLPGHCCSLHLLAGWRKTRRRDRSKGPNQTFKKPRTDDAPFESHVSIRGSSRLWVSSLSEGFSRGVPYAPWKEASSCPSQDGLGLQKATTLVLSSRAAVASLFFLKKSIYPLTHF